MQFTVTREQQARIDKWLFEEIYPEVIEHQRKEFVGSRWSSAAEMCWKDGYPYAGAIGGGVDYKFSPTGLGDVLIVSNAWNKKTLDVTEYDTW